jgi:thioredoxin-like negative regulator of GroEL
VNKLKNIDEIKSIASESKMALLYISSENCNVCKVILPRLEHMLEQYNEIKSAKVDIEELPLLSGEYNVFTIPCILVFAEGKEIIREARYINIESIKEHIDRYYNLLFKE